VEKHRVIIVNSAVEASASRGRERERVEFASTAEFRIIVPYQAPISTPASIALGPGGRMRASPVPCRALNFQLLTEVGLLLAHPDISDDAANDYRPCKLRLRLATVRLSIAAAFARASPRDGFVASIKTASARRVRPRG
jgi:hypothetical protein